MAAALLGFAACLGTAGTPGKLVLSFEQVDKLKAEGDTVKTASIRCTLWFEENGFGLAGNMLDGIPGTVDKTKNPTRLDCGPCDVNLEKVKKLIDRLKKEKPQSCCLQVGVEVCRKDPYDKNSFANVMQCYQNRLTWQQAVDFLNTLLAGSVRLEKSADAQPDHEIRVTSF